MEMFKIKNNISPEIVSELSLQIRESQYNLWENQDFLQQSVRTVYQGTENISYLGPKIWDMVPTEIKKTSSINKFINVTSRSIKSALAEPGNHTLLVLVL